MSQMIDGQSGIAENLKKGITELLILSFLKRQDMHIYAITNQLDVLSNGACRISYPYAAIYRLINGKYIVEAGKRVDDNRLRQFYHITEKGEKYLFTMRSEYDTFINGANSIFGSISTEAKHDDQ